MQFNTTAPIEPSTILNNNGNNTDRVMSPKISMPKLDMNKLANNSNHKRNTSGIPPLT